MIIHDSEPERIAPVLFLYFISYHVGKGEMGMGKMSMRKSVSIPIGIAIGTSFAIITTLGGAAILASIIGKESIPENAMKTGCMMIHFLSAALGALVSAGITKQRRLPVCIITAAAYFGIMLAMTALLFEGQYQGFWLTALIVTAGGGTAVLPAVIRKGSGGRIRKLRPIR